MCNISIHICTPGKCKTDVNTYIKFFSVGGFHIIFFWGVEENQVSRTAAFPNKLLLCHRTSNQTGSCVLLSSRRSALGDEPCWEG